MRKVWRQLKREAIDAPRCQIARLMKQMGLAGAVRGRAVKTTRSDRAAPGPLDRVNRQFRAAAPNALWVSDVTYVATWQGFVYVAFVIDAFARRIVGRRVSRSAHADFVLDALEQALCERRPARRGGSCIIVTAACSTFRSATRSVCSRLASSHPWAASATATIMRSPKRSTACSKPR